LVPSLGLAEFAESNASSCELGSFCLTLSHSTRNPRKAAEK